MTVRPVNVSSVPQRSPFRYPGGKTWLIPTARKWLLEQKKKPKLLLEPFAGGGSISLLAAAENLVEHVRMVEIDPLIAAVWQTILSKDANWLINSILKFEMTMNNLQMELAVTTNSTRRIAFQTILRNRTAHGGIMAPGAGTIKHGENGKGLLSRWYPETLARRIGAIHGMAERITFVETDGIAEIQKIDDSRTCIFIDPPYTAGKKQAGIRLYQHAHLDHENLFTICAQNTADILMTYDDAPEIRKMAKNYQFKVTKIGMQNTRLTQMNELLIARDFRWLRAKKLTYR